MIFKKNVYIVLDYNHCILYIATCKWPLALCCLINWLIENNAFTKFVFDLRDQFHEHEHVRSQIAIETAVVFHLPATKQTSYCVNGSEWPHRCCPTADPHVEYIDCRQLAWALIRPQKVPFLVGGSEPSPRIICMTILASRVHIL